MREDTERCFCCGETDFKSNMQEFGKKDYFDLHDGGTGVCWRTFKYETTHIKTIWAHLNCTGITKCGCIGGWKRGVKSSHLHKHYCKGHVGRQSWSAG